MEKKYAFFIVFIKSYLLRVIYRIENENKIIITAYHLSRLKNTIE